jgi:hypothetical protein
MKNQPQLDRRSALFALLAPAVCGCLPIPSTGPDESLLDRLADHSKPARQRGSEGLREALDQSLNDGFYRELDVSLNGAWQILHGILAYGTQCVVQTENGPQKAVDYLIAGGKIAGFDPIAADMLGEPPRRGIRFELDPGSLTGQGHQDQWLAVLSQCGLSADTRFVHNDFRYTLDDAVLQTTWDVPRNLEQEFSWTVIGLTAFRPTDFSWTARDGQQWSIERLIESEVEASLEQAACGGTHRLIGMAMTLDRHRRSGGRMGGVWAKVEDSMAAAIEKSKAFQNGDGSFSTTYLHRYGWSPDLSDVLRTTGHVLEFLSIAGSDDLLGEAWVEAAAWRLCDVLRATRVLDLECGALYHALHGVILYRNRRFKSEPWALPVA